MTAPARSRARRGAFGLIVAAGLLLAAEIGLRLIGFHYDKSLSYMEFNFPRPHELHQIFEPDPVLLWRLRPNYDFGQGFPLLNPQGFRGPDFARLPVGVFRIACIGDSVTFGRPEAEFPLLLERRLSADGRTTQVLNFGVPGYSSWQGRQLLRRVLAAYHPDMVIILFGWNDHWLAKGFPDAEQKPAPSRAADWLAPLRWLRLYQFINHARAHLVGEAGKPVAGPPRPRVSPDQYRDNLLAMAAACRAAGVPVIFATAPSGISAGKVPDYLVPMAFITAPAQLAILHRRYNDVARAAAAKAGVEMCDLDAAFEAHGVATLFTDPAKDLIHPNAAGYALMAEKLAECVEKVKITKPAP